MQPHAPQDVELTILMPCLDEAETIASCVDEARAFLERAGVSGEVLIADNGSTDGSTRIAEAHGARVVRVDDARVRRRAAAKAFVRRAARTSIMGDADGSYDFAHLEPFVERLRDGCDLVVGNRFRGGIAPGAMPPLHRYLGNPVLSFLGRLFFTIPIGDFHCGLRGFRRDRMLKLGLRTTGMEYASEMIVRAALREYVIAEVPTTLSPDGRLASFASADLARRLAPPAFPADAEPAVAFPLSRSRPVRHRHRRAKRRS